GDVWTATLSLPTGETRRVEARAVVNAAGPWVDDVDGLASPGRNQGHVRLVKGSHIITRKLYDGDHAYFFQNADGRIMFAIPYERGAFTLIGTTDVPFTADRDRVEASPEEVHYLCEGASTYFQTPIAPQDVVATYSGVRPLYDDQSENASEVTRDYVLSLNDDGPPILSVFGGKITTYRKLAEGALKTLAPFFPNLAPEWTECSPLPGGDMPGADFDSFVADMTGTYPWLPADWARRFARAYGTRMIDLIGEATSVEDLGQHFGGGLTEAEVTYLIANEFAQSADDVLWRRSKLGLHLSEEEIAAVSAWFERRPVQADPSASR
ncbi:MAG: glycerol-3-phosphate dehydrogenase, partial [Pseudomonadota bacterium]